MPITAPAIPNWLSLAEPAARGHQRYIDPVTGIRYYPIPTGRRGELVAVPGVTSILSTAETAADRQRLDAWRERELAAGRDPNEARERGSRVHNALEAYIRGLTPQLDDWDDVRQLSGMTRHLDLYEEFLWNERPMRTGWEHTWSAPLGDPHRLARVWSRRWGFAGTPDLIGRLRSGRLCLGDFKTSKMPYFRCSGDRVPGHKEVSFKKYKKTVRQLCAYRLAVEETLGLEVDCLMIIVGLPGDDESQLFLIEGPEIELETQAFKRLAAQFWQRHAECQLQAA